MTNEELQQQIDELRRELNLLKASATIPYEVDVALRERFNLSSFTPLQNSSKSASSENQAVNESGTGNYNVLKSPDGFLEVTINGAIKYIPIYT